MKVVIGLATYYKHNDLVKNALLSFGNQADEIWLYDNDIQKDITDLGKFYGLTQQKEPCYYFSCDADLYYPDDYVKKTIEYIEEFNCIVTYHGRKLKGQGLDYYTEHLGFPFNKNLEGPVSLDVAGTGVTAFRLDYFNPSNIINSEYMKMSDLVFSLEAAKRGRDIICAPHSKDWIIQQEVNPEDTILHTEKNNCLIQNKLADEIFRIKNNF